MSAITRWILAHKRIVVFTWTVLTIAGFAAAGAATRALDPEFPVPNTECWETNVAIARHYFGTRGDSTPLVSVVTLPQGKTVAPPGVRAELQRVDAALHNRKFASLSGGDGTSDLGLYKWDALAADAAVAPTGSGFRGFSMSHVVDSREGVDPVLEAAATAGGKIVKSVDPASGDAVSGWFTDPDGDLWQVAARTHSHSHNDRSLSNARS